MKIKTGEFYVQQTVWMFYRYRGKGDTDCVGRKPAVFVKIQRCNM
jgi:hypothetical protein